MRTWVLSEKHTDVCLRFSVLCFNDHRSCSSIILLYLWTLGGRKPWTSVSKSNQGPGHLDRLMSSPHCGGGMTVASSWGSLQWGLQCEIYLGARRPRTQARAAPAEPDAHALGVRVCVLGSLLPIPVIGSIARGSQRLNCSMRLHDRNWEKISAGGTGAPTLGDNTTRSPRPSHPSGPSYNKTSRVYSKLFYGTTS